MIGVLYICTGKYDRFWKDFFISAEKFLLPSYKKTYFVFTDAEEIYAEDNPAVYKIYQEFLGWPFDTLMRFEIFSHAIPELKKCDYLFFFNANTIFVDYAGDEILPGTANEGLVATLHPAFWNKHPDRFSYERYSESTAYIPFGKGKHYFMGACNGGETTAFLRLTADLNNEIHTDLKNGLIAIWHDESHLNHYLLDKHPLILSPSYCFPEDSTIPFKPILLIIDKMKHGGHNYLRNMVK